MSTQIATQTTSPTTHSRGSSQRGRRGNRARGTTRGGRGGEVRGGSKQPGIPAISQDKDTDEGEHGVEIVEDKAKLDDDIGTDAALCFICAEPVKYYAVSQCNHRTCHVCALRLRALYKKSECTFCKVGRWAR